MEGNIVIGLAAAKSGKGGMDKKADMCSPKIASIVARLFADRTYAHNAHLKTSSYAVHKALNKFYDEVVDLADDLAEIAQGKYGKLDIPVGQVSSNLGSPADTLEASITTIIQDANGCNVRAINAKIDEIEMLYLSTIYKLRELH